MRTVSLLVENGGDGHRFDNRRHRIGVHPGLSRVIIAATIGNVLEGFDFVVYGFFAVTIAEVFFPARNPTLSLLITLARSAWAMSFDHWARSSLAPTPTAPGARLG